MRSFRLFFMDSSMLFSPLKMRIEQELVFFRYMIYCNSGKLFRSFFVLRWVGFLLTLMMGMSFLVGMGLGWRLIPLPVYISCVGMYLFLMVNTLFEKGCSKSRVMRWKNGFLGLILIQTTMLSGFSILESIDSVSHEQVRAQIQTVTLPGGVRESDIVGMKILSLDVLDSIVPTASTTQNTLRENTPQDAVDTTPIHIVGRALNYPNPCRLGAEGTTIGYELSKDADIDLRIYDPFGREIYREQFFAGQPGGRGGSSSAQYNRVSVTSAKLMTSNVPAGIYYFVVISGDSLLAKGKIAALP